MAIEAAVVELAANAKRHSLGPPLAVIVEHLPAAIR
jgi:hypothetical protein